MELRQSRTTNSSSSRRKPRRSSGIFGREREAASSSAPQSTVNATPNKTSGVLGGRHKRETIEGGFGGRLGVTLNTPQVPAPAPQTSSRVDPFHLSRPLTLRRLALLLSLAST